MAGRNEPFANGPRHPIQVVSRRTGLTSDTLRAWEKRYAAVEPERASGGRRLYSDEDIERLSLLRRASKAGRRIGDIAGMPTGELKALVAEDEAAGSVVDLTGRPVAIRGTTAVSREKLAPAEYVSAIRRAVGELDPEALERSLARACVDLSTPELFEQVIEPAMRQIGDDWVTGEIRVSQEHLASAVVRSLLGRLLDVSAPHESAPKIVVGTPAGQIHEIGALMAAITAIDAGWGVVYLGPNLPANDLAHAVRETGARALVLSIVYPGDDPRLPAELVRIREATPDPVSILVGGRSASSYGETLEQIGAVVVRGLTRFRDELYEIRSA